MKMHFGKKIVLLYLSFMALILTLVAMSFNYKVDLVSKDYYAQELQYEDKITAIKNENELKNSITTEMKNGCITFVLDSCLKNKNITGQFVFYRPSNSELDKTFEMKFENGTQKITTTELKKGFYKIEMVWKMDYKNYFKEQDIQIN